MKNSSPRIIKRIRSRWLKLRQPSLTELLKYFSINVTGIIHVGANHGQEIQVYKRLTNGPIFLIEGEQQAFDILCQNAAPFPSCIPIKAMCSDAEEETEFYLASNNSASSSLLMPTSHSSVHPTITFDNPVKCSTTTLNSLSEIYDFSECNIIVIDVQGAELKVLAGANKVTQHIVASYVEVSLDLYAGAPRPHNVISVFAEKGFQLRHLFLHQQKSGDAFFTKTS